MKDGIKTSEFYVAVAGVLALVWQQVQSKCNFDPAFFLSVGGVVISYIAGRSWIKSKLKK